MYGSFRFTPPAPRPGLLSRPRLLRSLVKRWEHRVTIVVGGAGLGKTTLLAQAVAENRLAPRGEDLWIGLDANDAHADRLAHSVATVLARSAGEESGDQTVRRQETPEPAQVADLVWRRAPTEACLIVDDVHRLRRGSSGARWLGDLIANLPANGHLVLAGRSEPPVAPTRQSPRSTALHLDEGDLLFDEDELAAFATHRGLDPGHLASTGGWPAMAELTATVDRRFAGRYLWDEILQPLGTERRHVLAVISDLGEADDALASTVTGNPVSLEASLEGVPLIARSPDGWHRPHSLWRKAPGLALPRDTRATIRRRAAGHLVERGRFDEAFTLLQEAELWDDVPSVLRAACLQHDRVGASQLRRWLAASPEAVRASAPGQLATGLHAASMTPEAADPPLQEAAARCRAEGDVEAELTAISRLGQMAWWHQDLRTLAELFPRVAELEARGVPTARGLAAFGRALQADLAGRDEEVLAELDSIEPNALDATWETLANWLRGVVCLFIGRPDEACEIAERRIPGADPTARWVLTGLQIAAWWHVGRIDQTLEMLPRVREGLEKSGVANHVHLGKLLVAVCYAQIGDTTAAKRCYDDTLTLPKPPRGVLSMYATATWTALQLAEGDEVGAAATLRSTLLREGKVDHAVFDRHLRRTGARVLIPYAYVLVPETREYLDRVDLRASLWQPKELAERIVALREGRADAALRTYNFPPPGFLRGALHFRFAAELAVGLTEAGRPEGQALLEALGPPGRRAARELPRTQPARAKAARTLLAAVPAPPPRPVYLAVLGPLVLRRDGPAGAEMTHPDLRRRRVHTLLAYLVGRRRTSRTAICDALWPGLDERSAANNLSVTLNHLLRLLEPDRATGEPAYLLRIEGRTVQLATGTHLRIDVDDFDQHLAAGEAADTRGVPSSALDHYLAAVELYRDDLHLDVPDADWLALDREHYRTRFVTTATRASQLLLGRGDTTRAQTVAHRALSIDPWSEDAYTILVASALTRGDHATAHRLLRRCLDTLGDLGVAPSPTTRQLQHRLMA